ncbi:interferon-induced protein with tetratricopeptide repeats 5 [Biomphalaria pfeifferi]|uniref:Interferon-induced protein with tetratricopeptide repeats 5 n=1 Tax=Biomphalaria pfeifferi TaxID=112525 RepID=A0AAD8BBZ7_BIOPF|nr:interferon-induced protein with tetratricopeptide repeats 5 [Biomphalaria pfeifferi]
MSLNINEDLKEFPCTFNLARGHKVTQERFRHVKNNVESEIDCSPEEQIRNKNILTWVMFNLGDKHKAEELNREALKDSEDKNITALGNYVFILFNKGYKLKSQNTAFQKLLALSKDERFEHMKIEALAEQAYCFTRLGGEQNYKICIDLFKKCVDRCPHNYDWKFGLGLVYRRFTNFSSISQEQKEELIAESAQLLFEVAKCGNDKLKGLAYAQLVVGYMTFPKQQDRVFKDYDLQSLCEEALKYGNQKPTVLTHVGRCLKDVDVDKAIDLLKKSLELRLNSIACHHLGLSYEKKFENYLLQKNPCPLDDSKHQKESNAADSKPLTGQTNESLLDSTITTSSMMQDTSSRIDQTSNEEDFLMEAERCYIKAIEISYDENIPAKLHLGDFYFRLEKFDKALAQYNQIIDSNQGSSYLLCLVNALDKAGKCLKTYNDPDSLSEAHENFTKAITLAADLVSNNRESAESTSAIWESFKTMLDENEQMTQSRTKNKNKVKLLELVQAHRDIVLLVVQTFRQDPETDDLDIVKSGLTSGLKSGQYEDALLILNLASTIAAITLNPLWSDPEMLEIRAETYLTTAWARLIKDSPDYIRTFQQMFQLRYGQCVGMVSDAEEETLTKKGDILIVNDETLDSEECPDITTKLASNLLYIFQVIFGLETSRNLEMSTDYSHMQEEALLQEMSNYSLVLLVVGDNDSSDYNSMLQAVHKVQGPEILLVSLRAELPIPLILQSKEAIHVARVPWNHIRFTETLLQSCQEPSSNDIINKLFQGDKDAIVRLFCCLVGKDFQKILQIFKSKDL